MIRERRSKEKLQHYYDKYLNEGILDPNLHPWVAESWQYSRSANVPHETMSVLNRWPREELAIQREKNKEALEFLDGLYQEIREYFNIYNLSLLLLNEDCHVLKSYAMPFFQRTPGELEGAHLSEENIGTSSISIAHRHQTPFLLFGPEMWIRECQNGDAASTPIIIDGRMKYILTMVSVEQEELSHNTIVALLLSMKYSMETHLNMLSDLEAKHAILNAIPMAAYHLLPGGEVTYANRRGILRLVNDENAPLSSLPLLSDTVLNYNHTPLYKGFNGVPSYNKEVTWITPHKTYEDITTVIPLLRNNQVQSVVAVSLTVEDLRTLLAHAAAYSARYTLSSLVGESSVFIAMKDKSYRAARNRHNILLQGEAGTGKQRLAHGIHQASARAAGPLIALRCGDMPADLLENELFGTAGKNSDSIPGKLELASGGTLFLDEIEKLPTDLADKLANVLENGQVIRQGETSSHPIDVRIIAASDGDFKRLAHKSQILTRLYNVIAQTVIRTPSLRNRAEDIPLLARHIIQELSEQHNLPEKVLSPAALDLLKSYDWPGNTKQLQGVLEQAFFNVSANTITEKDIQLPGEVGPGKAWKQDRDVFIDLWKSAGGNISRLAVTLNVSRVTLYRYMQKYGLEKE